MGRKSMRHKIRYHRNVSAHRNSYKEIETALDNLLGRNNWGPFIQRLEKPIFESCRGVYGCLRDLIREADNADKPL